MIVAALLLLQAATPPTTTDVVVIGQKLDRFRAQMAYGKDGERCRVRVSTGDAEIDRVGCDAIRVCYPPFQSRYQATNDRAIKPSTRKVMQGALNQELRDCFAGQTKAGIADLAARRAAAGGGA